MASEDDWEVELGPDIPADLEGLSDVILVIGDDMEWNDYDVPIAVRYSLDDDETDLLHDARHMFNMWDRISNILTRWGERTFEGLNPVAYEKDVTVVYRAMFPLTDRGKWFVDWVAEELAAFDTKFIFEIDDSEEAHQRRQELEARLAEWRAEQKQS